MEQSSGFSLFEVPPFVKGYLKEHITWKWHQRPFW
jgi:hypothetical protein